MSIVQYQKNLVEEIKRNLGEYKDERGKELEKIVNKIYVINFLDNKYITNITISQINAGYR